MKTDKLTEMVLENYEFTPDTVRIKGQYDEYLFYVNHSTDYKRTKKDAAEIAKIIVNRFNSYDALLGALKRFIVVYERKSNIDKLGWNSAYSEAKAIIDSIEPKLLTVLSVENFENKRNKVKLKNNE